MKTIVKKTFTLLFAALPLLAAAQTETAPAFPGAEGHGRYTTGGRGGKVIHVTNLNDSGTGSLRAALSQLGKRIIVFDVAGDIHLKSNLVIKNGDVSILGQTSPGGITICDQTFENKANNVIIRFVRFRRGELVSTDDGADAAWGRNRSNIIIDHCSFSWSTDEVASWYDNKNFTMQWCVCAEGLASGHTKGTHSYGGIWGGKNASFHHTMIAHVNNRVPRINGARYQWSGYDKTAYPNTVEAERVDFRNNVYYNWGNGNGCYGGPGGGYCNIVNCYYKAGPATKNKTRVLQASVGESGNSTQTALLGMASRYYINGNYVHAASAPESYDWNGVLFDNGHITINGEKYTVDNNNYYSGEHVTYDGKSCVKVVLDEPVHAGEVTTHSAEVAFQKMLEYGGASLYRDGHDARYMEEARTGTVTYTGSLNGWKGILDKCVDVIPDYTGGNPYPWLSPAAGETRPADFDTDRDGIPDAWEIANGLNPNDASDASLITIDTRGWYTNLEVYANSLVEHIVKAQNADAIDAVDEYYPAFVSTGIDGTTVGDKEVVATMYHNLQGQRIDANAKGVKIKTVILKNNQRISTKVID
ncbi:pectate lyase [Palleniella muris]|uniref:Pectate lyase n=1 Tax=Palleniella muris TaxID=3038145 RepID=A0AC61QQV3_9BACT|nr:pectate lyase [Palleniella muris]TGX82484.1 pectate lyase [Palleniella muris]